MGLKRVLKWQTRPMNAWKANNPSATTHFLYRNNVIYIVLLWGGLQRILSGQCILNIRNKTFGDYIEQKNAFIQQLSFLCHGRYTLVSSIFLLWNGRK